MMKMSSLMLQLLLQLLLEIRRFELAPRVRQLVMIHGEVDYIMLLKSELYTKLVIENCSPD